MVPCQGVAGAVGCFGAWWVLKASEQTKAAAEELLSPVEGFCASCYHWAKDKLTGADMMAFHLMGSPMDTQQ